MSGIRIAYHRAVLIINHPVVVQIPETDITLLGTRLNGMSIHLLLILEYSVCHISIKHIDGIVIGKHGDIRVVYRIYIIGNIAVQFLDFILVVCVRQVRLPSQYALKVYGMERHFNTCISYLSRIRESGTGIFKS